MTVPKMILFDNGSTLTCEPDIDPLRAMRAVMPHITNNPKGLTAEELVAAERQVFKEIRPVREAGFLPDDLVITDQRRERSKLRRTVMQAHMGMPVRPVAGQADAGYVPVAYLGSQVVAGTNHAFLCQMFTAYPGLENDIS